MALFKKDSKEEKGGQGDLSWVIKKPRVTEKAAFLTEHHQYIFDVEQKSNKNQIKKAVKDQYKVTPVAVNIIRQAARKELVRGRKVHKKGNKKAIVTLKKGETIDLI
ncbi:MAG: 50S ribosomal protein L23 [Candidatus Pacebacteria bacterium]|nr:50S ribosomal protein L23 [Candidatus Paceibacterota bacterium]